jgi:DNA repair protein RadA/Sms
MAKAKTVFICSNCGTEAPKWIGRCPSCGEWNTFTEEVVVKKRPGRDVAYSSTGAAPVRLHEISRESHERIDTRTGELNRVLGGGLVPGSVVLIGGEPGIGKSTLALQMAMGMTDSTVLYVSGEESPRQIRMRADRIGRVHENCYILSEVSLQNLLTYLNQLKPGIVIVDSVQTLQDETLESSPGSISQIRECAAKLMKYAKETATPVFLIGHITKDGTLAGPKILEHIVDTVLLFEGDRHYLYRILRATKNRFGATDELGIFEMQHNGLKEVDNPSEVLINKNNEGLSGITTGVTIDGIRPFLIEVQALVSTAAYGTPQRVSTGYDVRRLNMLLAVLERRAGFKLSMRDVFLNLAGGLRVTDPALDLAIIGAVLSSNLDRAVTKKMCFSAEVGLSGEIRPVNRIESRIKEAGRLGFATVMISGAYDKISLHGIDNIRVIRVNRVEEAVKQVFSAKSQ